MARDFFTGWSDDEIAMHGTQRTPEELAKISAERIAKAIAPAAINKMPGMPWTDSKPTHLFTNKSDGFTFDRVMWKNMHTADRDRYRPDAIAHRDEAVRRMVVCRIEGDRQKECDHWTAQYRFLESLYRLPEIKNE
jgi:hypothetical protein